MAKRPRKTLNQQLVDDLLRHASLLPQFEDDELRRLIGILDEAHDEISGKISTRLRDLVSKGIALATDDDLADLRELLREIKALLVSAYQRLKRRLTRDLRRFAEAEAEFFQQSLARTEAAAAAAASGGVTLTVGGVAVELAHAIVTDDPFQGKVLSEWIEGLADGEVERLRSAIDQGLFQGESVQQIVRRIYGTRGEPKRGTVIFSSRRDVETFVRTAVQHVSSGIQARTVAENAHLLKSVRWMATLDSATCELCASRDGKLYDPATYEPQDDGPPWGAGPGRIHPNCRCVEQPVVKSLSDLEIEGEEREVRGERAATTSDLLVNGTVPDTTTYGEWLKTQPEPVVEQILGTTRAKLFLSGRVSFTRLIAAGGGFLSVAELRKRFASILEAA